MTFLELKQSFLKRLSAAGFDSPRLEAHFIVCEAGGFPDKDFFLHAGDTVPGIVQERANSFLERRLRHEPYQYIFGHMPFREIELAVGPGCLIPRPETEFSIDLMLQGLPLHATVCELGSGSGAIALAIAAERPDLMVTGIELSPAAMRWAEHNLQTLGLPNVRFLPGDLYTPVAKKTFDLIAGNLPYIPEEERNALPPNVRDYEPPEALFAGPDGLSIIRRALAGASEHLNPGGRIFLELDQVNGEQALLLAQHNLVQAELLLDQYGKIRFLSAIKPISS